MPARLPPLPWPGEAEAEEDLDARIHRAERELIARDERVRRQVGALGRRVQRVREPARWAMPLVGGAALLVGAWWVWRRGRRAVAGAAPAAGAARAAPAPGPLLRGTTALLRWLVTAWPLLPENWRQRWGQTPTAAMFRLGSRLGRSLARWH